jgi:hypothetical protein
MIVFLLTSFLSFLIVSLVILIHPQQAGGAAGPIKIPFVGNLTLGSNARLTLRRALTAAVIVACLIVIWLLFGGDDLSRTRYLPNFLFGLIFGPVFAFWISNIFYFEKENFSIAQGVLGVILIVLFIVGLLGAETARLAQHYSRHLSKVGLGGAEITFTDPGRGDAHSAKTTPPPPPPGQGGGKTPDSVDGLYNLSQLDFLIERDCGFIAMAQVPVEKDCSLVKGTSQPRQLAKQSAQLKESAEQASLAQAADFAGLSISNYAQCVAAVYDNTPDDGMVAAYLRPLALRFQELSEPSNLENGFVQRAIDTHRQQTQQLLEHLFPVFFIDNSDPKSSLDKPSFSVRKGCARFLASVCNPDFEKSWASRPHKISKLQEEAEQWVAAADSQQKLKDCRKDLDRYTTVESESMKIRFNAFYLADKETGFYSRPYVAIAHASLMLSLGAPEAGISRLYDWIERYEKATGLGEPNVAALGKDNSYKVWYAIRARSVLFTYMDKWLTRLDARAPNVGRDMMMANLQRYLELLQLFPPAADVLQKLKTDRFDLERQDYKIVAVDVPVCRYDEDLEASIILSYLATGNLFAYYALKDRNYERYAGTVRKVVRDSMNADASCIAARYSPAQAAALHSEALELQARILMRDAAKQKQADDTDSAEKTLKSAEAATRLALQLIKKWADRDLDTRKQEPRFMDRIASTKPIDTQETAQRTLAEIRQQLDELR